MRPNAYAIVTINKSFADGVVVLADCINSAHRVLVLQKKSAIMAFRIKRFLIFAELVSA